MNHSHPAKTEETLKYVENVEAIQVKQWCKWAYWWWWAMMFQYKYNTN